MFSCLQSTRHRKAGILLLRRRHAKVTVFPVRGLFIRKACAFAMKSRLRFLITAALVCHVLLHPLLVTSQLHASLPKSSPTQSFSRPEAVSSSLSQTFQDISWSAITQELDGPIIKLRGMAQIHYGAFVLRADTMTYNRDTGEAKVEGNVVLDGGPNDEHI